MRTGSWLLVLTALATPCLAASPSPATLIAPFCAAPHSGRCIGPQGHPVRFWWGHPIQVGRERRYAGFVTLLPGPADLPAQAGIRQLAVAEFVRRGASWAVADLSGPFGTLQPPASTVDTSTFAPVKAQSDGTEVIAVPTAVTQGRTRSHSFQMLRRGPGGWAYAGGLPAATDDLLACPHGHPADRDDPDACDTEHGNLLFDGPTVDGWPGVVVNVDLLSTRNGQPFTSSGWKLHYYVYDPASQGYMAQKQ